MTASSEAARRLAVLAQPAADEILQRANEHARQLYLPDDATEELRAQFESAWSALSAHGTMTGDVVSGWKRLLDRVRDQGVRAKLASIDAVTAVGACSGGEVTAGTFRFDDGSNLILFDHGLATLTWLAGQLAVVTGNATDATPLSTGDATVENQADPVLAARTLRLAISRLAAGGRAGVTPPLKLDARETGIAGLLVGEMDLFVLAHEAAHILLGHFDPSRQQVGVVGGSNHLMGKARDEEFAADHLALTLMFDDAFEAGTISKATVMLRVRAVALFLATIDLYERSCFLFQPSSHPPSRQRWDRLVEAHLSRWMPNRPEPGALTGGFIAAIDDLDDADRRRDAFDVALGWGDRLDRPLWNHLDWDVAANIASMICADSDAATAKILTWPHWRSDSQREQLLAALVDRCLHGTAMRSIVHDFVANGNTITRLAALTRLLEQLDAPVPDYPPDGAEPFPTWAVAVLAMNAVAEGVAQS